MIRVILVDDHAILRDGIRMLLAGESDLEVVGTVGSGQMLLDLLPITAADVVVLDLNMPGMDGFTTLEQLHEHHPAVKVLVLSMLDHERYVGRALDAGAKGYILKNAGSKEIIHAIRIVAQGYSFLCTELGLDMMRKLLRVSASGASLVSTSAKFTSDLSARELEVLTLIAEGLTNAEIADKLFTSRRTIETHRQNIIEKTQAKNTAALIKFAVSSGLIT